VASDKLKFESQNEKAAAAIRSGGDVLIIKITGTS
jgi:hypothetical protein